MEESKLGGTASSAHDEVVDAGEQHHPIGDSMVAAYEERRVDLRTIMALVALAITYESVILAFVLPAAVLLTINADIGPSSQLTWAPTAWTLSQGVIMTIAGSLSDICGRRNFALAGNLFGLVGCIVGCRANSIPQVIAALTITGIGSGSQLLSLACANEIVPKKARGKAIAALNVASMPGSCFGSLIAYRLVATLNWRWTFYLGIIINGLAFILIAVFYWPPSFIGLHPEGKTRRQQFKELDFIGLVLFGGGVTIFLMGISWGNNPYPWASAQVLVPLLLGILSFVVAFPLWEIYSPAYISKLCPPEIFVNVRTFVLPLIVSFVSGSLLVSLQVFWPQQVQLLFTTDPQKIGWYSVAYNTPVTLVGAAAAFSFTTFGHTRIQFSTVTFLSAVFIAAMSAITPEKVAQAIVLVVFAAGFVGATHMLKILMLQFGAPDKHIGLATGLMGSTTAIGGAMALAIYGSIIRDKATSDLAPSVAAAVSEAGLPTSALESFLPAFLSHNSTALEAIDGLSPAILTAAENASKEVYSQAFKLVYLVTIAFGVPACIAAFFTPSVDHKLTSQINVSLDAPHLLGHGKGEAKVLYTEENQQRDEKSVVSA